MTSEANKTQVKECISCLCKLLKFASICNVTPETFRQSKCDKDESIFTMKQLIISMASTLGYTVQSFGNIFNIMHQLGYPRSACLQEQSLSSCELLYCFAWLLHSSKIIEVIKNDALKSPNPIENLLKLKNKQKHQSCMDTLKMKTSSHSDVDCLMTDSAFNSMSTSDQSKYISWLMGKIEVDVCHLNALQINNNKLSAKIINKTFDSMQSIKKQSPSNIAEVSMIKYPQTVKTCEREMEDKIHILHTYLQWKKNEDIFWDWLSDDFDGSSHDDFTDKEDVDEMYTKTYNCPSVDVTVKSFHDKLSELKTTLLTKQRMWLSRVKQNSSRLSKLRIEQKHQVEGDVASLLQQSRSSPQLIPSLYCTSVKNSLPIKLQTSMFDEELNILREEIESTEQLWKEELTLVANYLLDESTELLQFQTS